jgi:hypothetical protein
VRLPGLHASSAYSVGTYVVSCGGWGQSSFAWVACAFSMSQAATSGSGQESACTKDTSQIATPLSPCQCVRSFATHPPTHPQTHSSTHPPTHPQTHSSTHPPTHPSTHPPTHPPNPPTNPPIHNNQSATHPTHPPTNRPVAPPPVMMRRMCCQLHQQTPQTPPPGSQP